MKNWIFEPKLWRSLLIINLFLFIWVAWLVKHETKAIRYIDKGLTQIIRGEINEVKTKAALFLTHLGDYHLLLMLAILIAVALLVFRQYLIASVFFAGFLGSRLLRHVLKMVLYRERPNLDTFVGASNGSFPSGHMLYSVFFYLALALIVTYLLHKKGYLPKPWYGIVPGLVMVILIGWSRVYLGVHYPTDVIGGFFIGLAWLSLVVWLFLRTWRFSLVKER